MHLTGNGDSASGGDSPKAQSSGKMESSSKVTSAELRAKNEALMFDWMKASEYPQDTLTFRADFVVNVTMEPLEVYGKPQRE